MRTKEEIRKRLKSIEESYDATFGTGDYHTAHELEAMMKTLKWVLNNED